MYYEIVSQSRWRSRANNREEAIQIAKEHRDQWTEIGKVVEVKVYYRGELIFSTTNNSEV